MFNQGQRHKKVSSSIVPLATTSSTELPSALNIPKLRIKANLLIKAKIKHKTEFIETYRDTVAVFVPQHTGHRVDRLAFNVTTQ